jgi:hypothetical protein
LQQSKVESAHFERDSHRTSLDLRAELLARRELACKNFERFTFPGGASGQVQPTVVLPF